MKNIKIFIFLSLSILVIACKRDNPEEPKHYTVTVYQSQQVSKTNSLPTYVHYLPWFGTIDYTGYWNHWGSNTNNIKSNGERDISAVYYPLIDLYDNDDPDYLEYAFLCMKLCGVDGVFIDYYSELSLNDYPFNFTRTIAAMDMADKVGLKYAVVYEDQVVVAAANSGSYTKLSALTQNFNYLKAHIFNRANYVKVGGKPLFMIFGPSSGLTGTQWRSVIQQDAIFVGYYSDVQSASFQSYVDGTMSWTGASSNEATELNQCQTNSNYNTCIAGAMPGFETVNPGGPYTDPRNGANFSEGLQNAKTKNPAFLQIPTWNDWQEGTTIEPSVEYGYTRLQLLQSFTGVSYTQTELELTVQLYQKRKKYKGKSYENEVLDQVFYDLLSLHIDEAKQLLSTL